jgi:holo-ACP synthase
MVRQAHHERGIGRRPLLRFCYPLIAHASYLEARDVRQDALTQYLSQGHPATIFLSLNIPGAEKSPPGAKALYHWLLGELAASFADLRILRTANDLLGPYAIIAVDLDPALVKKSCIALEGSQAATRLADLDVYAADGTQIGRRALAMPARACLVCDGRAVDCMRAKRHAPDEVIAKANALLAAFRT